MGFIEELRWRGLIQDLTPGVEQQLASGITRAYVGFDPTADSLHIGNLVPITLLAHLQRHGHKPIVLVGGATGRVGDPSGKTAERLLLAPEEISHNIAAQKRQLEHFLTFGDGPTDAVMVNNYDWFAHFSFLDFIRDVGKHISVNYMMAKDSVKNRLEGGMSFTEFSYQLIQGYDFYHLHKHLGVTLQMGGSDQWGNITTGIELTRRLGGGEVHALTAPLVKRADGSKFGKSEGGNVWLDPERTSPYQFYQFWVNLSDEDALHLAPIYSFANREALETLRREHAEAPHQRLVQKLLASELTERVHGSDALKGALAASDMLFGNATSEALRKLSERDFLEVFQGVDQAEVAKQRFEEGLAVIDLLADESGFLSSRGEARRALKEQSIRVNKEKVTEEQLIRSEDLIQGRYVLLQRGKKKYFIVRAR